MRDILFRAKRIDNGEWVEGYLVKFGKESLSDNDRYGIMEDTTLIARVIRDGKIGLVMSECDYVYHNVKVAEVYPKTVCQYTSLTDKNGKKIWEGDIVRHEDLSNGRYIFRTQPMKNTYIRFDTTEARFERSDKRNLYKTHKTLEVIGNIFDNPELLKGVGK